MPFRIALSGLNASSAELRVIGNNVANASTTGFKKARTEFGDIFASSNLGVTSNAIGSGVQVSAVSQQFSQGNIGFTDNNLDLAVSGQGFYVLNDNGVNVYTRAGAFGVDRAGYIVNTQAQRLTGFQADSSGNITGAVGDLQLDTSDIAPNPTTSIDMALNLDASDSIPGSPVSTTTITAAATILDEGEIVGNAETTPAFNIRDNYGVNRSATITYTKTAANTWSAVLNDTVSGNSFTATSSIDTSAGAGNPASPSTLTFNWVPETTTGAQSPVVITMNTLPITLAVGGTTSIPGTGAAANGSAQGGFDPTSASSYNNSTSLSTFDSLGSEHLTTMYFRQTNQANEWEVFTYSDGTRVDAASGVGDQLIFSTAGILSTPPAPSNIIIPLYSPGGGAADMNIKLEVADLTQYGSVFSVNALVQDGFTTGRLSGIDISDTGVVTARFTNGQSRTLAQVALANFSNSQGLRQLGDTSWAESFESGAALVGAPGSGSLGLIQSGALEGSNVDLTEQLVNMITAQRNFQANAQVITTADTVTQTIINIR